MEGCLNEISYINVISPGFQTTVQDLGRYGFAHLGVSASGAADPVSLRIGNLLLGNPQNAAALELTLVGGEYQFESGCVFALTGSDFGATLDGQEIPLWSSVKAQAGQILRSGSTRSGARCYLCIGGGINTRRVLGSFSTHVMTSIGGFCGRPLRGGDRVRFLGQVGDAPFRPQRLKKAVIHQLMHRSVIRVTHGPQADLFSDEVTALFTTAVYHVTEETNRMGLRLTGSVLKQERAAEMVTEGVALGAVQIPPSGEPILLFVEHQTTGGYPKIANVVSADIHILGQLRPRDSVRFEFISFERAHELLLRQEAMISTQFLEFV